LELARARSAGLEPAVSQVYDLRDQRSFERHRIFPGAADCKSAIRQTASLRYDLSESDTFNCALGRQSKLPVSNRQHVRPPRQTVFCFSMNALESHWTRGRWFWAFLFLFIAHVAAVFWFAQRPHSPARWPAREPFFTFADDATLSPASLELARLRDPTLFALPSEHGFSGNAWLKFTPPPPLTNNWTEAPRWLPLPITELGSTFAQYVATNRPSEERLIEELPEISLAEVRVPAAVISTGSTFKVEGPLASRRLVNSISLPSAVTNIVLQRTELDVTVNAEGTTRVRRCRGRL
jgi:hypothetical protein